jgi:hypothetical protein
MKHILLLISIVTLVSCSQEPAAPFESTTDTVKRSGNNYGIVYVADLFAGQTTLVGSLEIANYNDTVFITYRTTGDWEMKQTHLFVGDFSEMPINGGGNPQVGRFPFKGNHPNGTHEVTYQGPAAFSGICYYNAAHAQVRNNNTGQTESLWADGAPIGGNSWATGFDVCF